MKKSPRTNFFFSLTPIFCKEKRVSEIVKGGKKASKYNSVLKQTTPVSEIFPLLFQTFKLKKQFPYFEICTTQILGEKKKILFILEL